MQHSRSLNAQTQGNLRQPTSEELAIVETLRSTRYHAHDADIHSVQAKFMLKLAFAGKASTRTPNENSCNVTSYLSRSILY